MAKTTATSAVTRTPRNTKTTEFKRETMQSEEAHLNGCIWAGREPAKAGTCLQTLPAEDQKVVVEFICSRNVIKNCREITGIEWNKVRSSVQNGRRNLKICMEKGKCTGTGCQKLEIAFTIICRKEILYWAKLFSSYPSAIPEGRELPVSTMHAIERRRTGWSFLADARYELAMQQLGRKNGSCSTGFIRQQVQARTTVVSEP